jgi:hypothetical protein
MPATDTRSAGAIFALQAAILGLVVVVLLLAGWAFAGISPLQVLEMVLQAIGDMWEAIKAFAGWLFGPIVAIFA